MYVWFLLPTCSYPNFLDPTLNIKWSLEKKYLKWALFQILSLFSLLNVIQNLIISLPTYPKFCWYVGLPRLRNFVNVYTNSRNRNDSVYTQLPYCIFSLSQIGKNHQYFS